MILHLRRRVHRDKCSIPFCPRRAQVKHYCIDHYKLHVLGHPDQSWNPKQDNVIHFPRISRDDRAS